MNTNSININPSDNSHLNQESNKIVNKNQSIFLIEKMNTIFESLAQIKFQDKIYFDEQTEIFGISGTSLTNNSLTNTLSSIPGLTTLESFSLFKKAKQMTTSLAQSLARTVSGHGIQKTIEDLNKVDQRFNSITEEINEFALLLETMDPMEWRSAAFSLIEKLHMLSVTLQSAEIGLNDLCKTYENKEEKIQTDLKLFCQKLKLDGKVCIGSAEKILFDHLKIAEEKILSRYKNIKNESVVIPQEEKKENLNQIQEKSKEEVKKEEREDVIHYEKGHKKTKDLIPTHKKVLGEGMSGKVHISKNAPEKVVKKSYGDLQHEFKIGKKLKHPNLMEVDQLYIKKNPRSKLYKLVGEKIEGKTIGEIYRTKEKNPKDLTLELIKQAKDCCLYLYDTDIVWKDINDGNIFINPSYQLKIIDFGGWQEIDDPSKKTFFLLLGAIELCGWLVKSSTIRSEGRKNAELEKKIIMPQYLMEEWPYQVITANISLERLGGWQLKLLQTIETSKNKKQMISDYFDHVYKTFEKIALEENLK